MTSKTRSKLKEIIIRKWLNKPSSFDNGWIKFTLGAYVGRIESDLTIADCSRSITLNASAGSKKAVLDIRKKLRILIESLEKIESSYEAYWEESQRLQKVYDEKKKNIPKANKPLENLLKNLEDES